MPLLIHEIKVKDLDSILESGYILTGKELNRSNYDASPMDKVFMTVLFNNNSLRAPEHHYSKTYAILFFDINMMEHRNPVHWSNAWMFGKFIKNDPDNQSVKYDSTKTPLENVKYWNEIYNKTYKYKHDYEYRGRGNNEVVFKGKVSIKNSLIGIYYTGSKSFPFENIMKSRRGDLKQFLDKYQK